MFHSWSCWELAADDGLSLDCPSTWTTTGYCGGANGCKMLRYGVMLLMKVTTKGGEIETLA